MSNERLDQGVFVFSWDFELAWGFHDNQSLPNRFDKYDSRAYIKELINILEQYGVPTTWATVGHLLLDSCDMITGRPHSDLPAPTEDWYDRDPCTSVNDDPLWYAPDLIDRLQNSDTEQEIGSHTFSHVTTSVDESTLSAELTKCQDLSEEEIYSFVSPRHGAVPTAVLDQTGYACYRTPSSTPPLRRSVYFYSGIGAPETGLPTRESNGVWQHPVSTYFFYNPLNKMQRRLPFIKRRWLESGLKRAVATDEVFHVWAHPHNFIGNDQAMEQFRWLIRRVDALRECGQIEPMTMRQLTARLERID